MTAAQSKQGLVKEDDCSSVVEGVTPGQEVEDPSPFAVRPVD